ncbi:MAG: CBS domain-containing protein [Anaerolineae bacterium]|nr:CBS domain-containing protein [Anaerolineae bacterium]
MMLNKVLVHEWMSKPALTIRQDAPINYAHEVMRQQQVRRLVVVNENNRILGIVTSGDIREAKPSDATTLSIWELNYLVSQLIVEKIMTHEVITIGMNSRMTDAAKLMLDYKIGGLPVVDDAGELVGVLTESDIFRMIVQQETTSKTIS